MSETRADALLTQWKLGWNQDLPPAVLSELNEIYRLLYELHCPQKRAKARADLTAVYEQRASESDTARHAATASGDVADW